MRSESGNHQLDFPFLSECGLKPCRCQTNMFDPAGRFPISVEPPRRGIPETKTLSEYSVWFASAGGSDLQ